MNKFYLALVNETKKQIIVFPQVATIESGNEVYTDETEANMRFGHLGAEGEFRALGKAPGIPGGDKYYVYRGDVPLTEEMLKEVPSA